MSPSWPYALAFVAVPFATWGALNLGSGYYEGTAGKALSEHLARKTKCSELRGEFFDQCQQTATRQQCEALFGQTRGRLFDGPPHLPFAKELDCSGVANED